MRKYADTFCFHFYNANPRNRKTGDCVVRALCTAMERPYQEVYKELYEFSVKTGYMLNDKKCYERYLESQGWILYKQPRRYDNTKYTGKEFCKAFQSQSMGWADYPKNIIAKIGSHHIVAIKEGIIQDIWDSSDYCIGNYWAKKGE